MFVHTDEVGIGHICTLNQQHFISLIQNTYKKHIEALNATQSRIHIPNRFSWSIKSLYIYIYMHIYINVDIDIDIDIAINIDIDVEIYMSIP